MTAGDIFHGPLSWPWAGDDEPLEIGGRALGRGDGARAGAAVRLGRASRRRRQRHRRPQRRDGGAGVLD
jgi:hypothetical protein